MVDANVCALSGAKSIEQAARELLGTFSFGSLDSQLRVPLDTDVSRQVAEGQPKATKASPKSSMQIEKAQVQSSRSVDRDAAHGN